MWAAIVAGAYAAWTVNAALLFVGRARQSDDIYYFLVFAVAVQAGLGAARLSEVIARSFARRGERRLADLTAFRNRHGERTLREVLAMALRESGGVKLAGQRIGYIADDDDRASYDNFRQWMRKLGLSAKRLREERMSA